MEQNISQAAVGTGRDKKQKKRSDIMKPIKYNLGGKLRVLGRKLGRKLLALEAQPLTTVA
jgi:hypothetical protein